MRKETFRLKTLFLSAILLYSPNALGQQKRPEIATEYYTPYGTLTFTFSDSQVIGTYPHENGKIVGKLEGHQLKGVWRQSDGTGAIVLTFSNDFNTFKGRYNHLETPDKWATDWSGTRKPEIQIRRYKTPWGILTCNFEGSQVWATYPWFNGRILGELNNNKFTGIWLQSNRGIGTLRITFAKDFKSFTGRYNDFNYHPKKWFTWKGEVIQ
jgi:hypothetical protein